MKKLIAGNWKMNCSLEDAKILIADTINGIHVHEKLADKCEFLVCPSYIYMSTIRHAVQNHGLLSFGAQDCSDQDNGAFTGDISASMLKESGCQYVIVGHSERRQLFGESDEQVAQKVSLVVSSGLTAIVCVGETLEERESGQAEAVVAGQVRAGLSSVAQGPGTQGKWQNIVVAYEPVWAIGTGKTATSDDAQAMHAAIRSVLKDMGAPAEEISLLYGGSVKADNASAIFSEPDVDGGLIGGASLVAKEFMSICRSFPTGA
jgi:triosephosphate isomerase